MRTATVNLPAHTNLPFHASELETLVETDRHFPGSVAISVRRFKKIPEWDGEDSGSVSYHFTPNHPEENLLELKFCLRGNIYCGEAEAQCEGCRLNETVKKQCREKVESIDVLSLSYSPTYLQQFTKSALLPRTLSEKVIRFEHPEPFMRILPLCNKTRTALENMLNHSYTGALENIFLNSQIQVLLLYALDCILDRRDAQTFTCKFLATDDGLAKIHHAKEVLLQHIFEPITIRELSKKVAINECYLKKGFKEVYGTTIFEFYQNQRMEHAKYLLYEKGLSVTDVSVMLGYSSISHFSTAFKKHTGIKPCELLLR